MARGSRAGGSPRRGSAPRAQTYGQAARGRRRGVERGRKSRAPAEGPRWQGSAGRVVWRTGAT
eukprot:6476689-Prymnesium_polylepis.1